MMFPTMAVKPRSRNELADLHLSLLKLELEEESKRHRQLINDKASTLKLVVERAESNRDTYVITLRHELNQRLPEHGIDQGTQVFVSFSPIVDASVQDSSHSAVVTKVTPVCLTLTFSYENYIHRGQTIFIQQSKHTDHIQLSNAMEWLKSVDTAVTNHTDEPAVPLVREMFKEHRQEHALLGPDVPSADIASPLHLINPGLDASQREAVKLALRDRPLTVIHGPPGTGKTITALEVILQHVKRGQRVLVCAPSNKAVDNLLGGLWKQARQAVCGLRKDDVIRLGQLARMDENLREFSTVLQLKERLARREQLSEGANQEYEETSQFEWDQSCMDDVKTLPTLGISFLEMHLDRKEEMVKLLQEAFVVMSTLTSVRRVELHRMYDLLVIDECSQATEAACWLAIPLARKVLLTGDPCQLPPTILSQEAARRGLAVSLMERQVELHGEGVVHMLDTQYRMHELIQAWSSKHLYGGRLKAAPEVGTHLLTGLPGVRSTIQTQPTLLLIDTAGCKLKETQNTKTNSYGNCGEADLVVSHTESLVKAGLQVRDIGVITPYKEQVKLVSERMCAAGLDVEVNSVDGYQGREKEAILLSLVRSNERRQVGFVGDRRRLNVAVTRARRHLFIVCDTATICRDLTILSLVRYMQQNGEVRSANGDQRPGGEDGSLAGADNWMADILKLMQL